MITVDEDCRHACVSLDFVCSSSVDHYFLPSPPHGGGGGGSGQTRCHHAVPTMTHWPQGAGVCSNQHWRGGERGHRGQEEMSGGGEGKARDAKHKTRELQCLAQ